MKKTADLDIELVVITGDVFDRSVSPQESVVLFEKALIGLSALCPVFVTPGNHVSALRLGYGGSFSWQRKTGKRVSVYFATEDRSVTSNRVTIQTN